MVPVAVSSLSVPVFARSPASSSGAGLSSALEPEMILLGPSQNFQSRGHVDSFSPQLTFHADDEDQWNAETREIL